MKHFLAVALLAAACVAPASDRSDVVPPDRAGAPSAPAPPPASPAPAAASIELSSTAVQGGLLRGRTSGVRALRLDGAPLPLAEDGSFLIGFDRDRTGTAVLEAELSDGRTVRRELAVAPRAWALEHIDAPLRPGGATGEAFRRRREGELARIAAARALDTGAQGWRGPFAWPAVGRISGVFGSQRVYRGVPGSFHTGVDVASGAGAPVTAPADGTVVLAGPPQFSLEGNLVIVDHGMGLNSAFLHLATVAVREGQRLRRGEPIGTVGATGRATGPHLHWSMKWQGARIDPAVLAGPMPR